MRKEDAKAGVKVRLLKECYGISAGTTGVIQENDGRDRLPLLVDVDDSDRSIWVDLHDVDEVKGMRKEDVKVGMKVLVKDSTHSPVRATRALIGKQVEVVGHGVLGCVRVRAALGEPTWYFSYSDIEPTEADPQVPSVTINGTVYVPEDTIKAPEPAPAPKFFWGQWVNVEGRRKSLAIVTDPVVNVNGDIRVVYAGERTALFRAASRCTPIGA